MVSTGYSPITPNRRGAIEPYVYELSRYISRTDKVHLFGIGEGKVKIGNLQVEAFSYKLAVPFALRRIFGPRIGYQVPYNAYLFKNFCNLNEKEKIDIIHIHDANSGFATQAIKKICHTPSVVSIHNEICSAASIRNCTKVLAVSNYIRDFLIEKKGLAKNQVDVLNIAINPDLYRRKRSNEEAKKELHLNGKTIILFAGRKCPEKGPQILIEALPEIVKNNQKVLAIFLGPDYTFGNRSAAYTEVLAKKAKSLGVEKNIMFEGFVSQRRLECFYEAADVCVFPSIWQEPFGKVILEAMSYEVPIVASAVGAVPEIISDKINGSLVPSGDAGQLAETINKVLQNPESAKVMVAEGKKKLLKNYTFESTSEKCLEIYKRIS
jgi:glycosyltransferase involved in cell wall biosynthesis